jgi:nucleoside-diphosphate-sugar epimerase
MANVFLTDSNNNLSISLLKKLLSNGHHVTVLANTSDAAEEAERRGATVIWGDLDKIESYAETLRHNDVVIHNSQILDLQHTHTETNVIETIIKTLRGTNKTFIYTSNLWVLGDTRNPADERSPLAPITLVAPIAHNETLVRESARDGIRSIVVRPGLIYGSENAFVEELIRRGRKERTLSITGSESNHLSLVHIDDVTELFLLVINSGKAGSVYHAVDGRPVPTRELLENIGKLFNIQNREILNSDEAKKKYGALAEAYSLNQQIDNRLTREELKWQPKNTDLKKYLSELERSLTVEIR